VPKDSPLLLDLAGVARLAAVQRPVATVWRSRFSAADDPFPPAVREQGGRPLFDATSVAQWLSRTEHGNNSDAEADAAASASPSDFDVADASHVAVVDALLALRSSSGKPVGGLAVDELHRRALIADPNDSCLVTEISNARAAWAEWADLLSDAAYAPIEASLLLERRHGATRSAAGSSGPLTASAEALLLALAYALVIENQAELVVSPRMPPSLVVELVSRVGDDVDLVVFPLPEGRLIRRRLLLDGLVPPASTSVTDAPRLFVERLSFTAVSSRSEMLRAVDELALGMRDHDRAIVLAPAALLIDSIAPSDTLARSDVLRSGRVRAIAKLPAGLISSSPREALGLWVLGREAGDLPPAEQVTAVADLTDATLTAATLRDLTNDVMAAMGNAQDANAHAFRFTRLVRTSSLLASRRALVTGGSARKIRSHLDRDLPALLDQALTSLGQDAPDLLPVAVPGPVVAAATVEQLIAARHLRLLKGTRVAADEYYDSGLIVVGTADLDDPEGIGGRHVDPIVFRARHPSARLTVVGDVVFRTAPTAKAWVDPDGSKVVLYPARILRIDRADPGGLVSELVATDVNESTGGPGAWRRWRLRRVVPQVVAPLGGALAGLASRREALARRIKALDAYSELLTAAAVSGIVTFTDPAATAASEH
jgi:hypothetical protein